MHARDPYCIVVFWEADIAALARFAAAQPGGSWRLRITGGHLPDRRVLDDALSLSLDHRFVAVPDPGCTYVAEVGFSSADGSWNPGSISPPVSTPVAGPSPLVPAPPPHESQEALPPTVPGLPVDPHPESRQPATRRRRPRSPLAAAPTPRPAARDSSPEDDARFLVSLAWDEAPSLEFPSSADLDRRSSRTQPHLPSHAPRMDQHPDSSAWTVAGSEGASEARLREEAPFSSPEFWFEVNAELIVYGRTEPNARVTVGGRPIPLRPDGSFRFQFSLPDGEYEMPVVAVNARNDDGRAALLEFSRHSEYTGVVGPHPQDPALNPPPVG
ncbi:MAG: DUF4912 domain-containing protein [Verrucomicrobiales bacterium]|nr:DUF4912 domain-containing protein [Verrucomicrobiales bacterium]